MNTPDHIFWVKLKILKFIKKKKRFRIRDLFDPGSGIRDGKVRIRDKHPGSATLVLADKYLAETCLNLRLGSGGHRLEDPQQLLLAEKYLAKNLPES